MNEIKRCKTCTRDLPSSYKHNKCESCRNKKIDGAKRILKVVERVGGVVAPVVVGMLLNKTKNKKK
ncbi:MAG: hypothetical protein E6238_06310 [Streptococcus sp.]|jgi:hypothetical protein|uniref:Uncharacterized protein n=1 Tax=Streptococcus oralis TaxID=1303 RepID=A0A3R9PRK8_STROR|nr:MULTISPECIES: hypothetical protein [Streptococcus]MDU5072506.1 hypothetical protein [Streptococcus sp.]RSI69217.1 hypothetical protein D8863_02635 [Streptococcus oralis]